MEWNNSEYTYKWNEITPLNKIIYHYKAHL